MVAIFKGVSGTETGGFCEWISSRRVQTKEYCFQLFKNYSDCVITSVDEKAFAVSGNDAEWA